MKKFLGITMVLCMMFAMVACSSEVENDIQVSSVLDNEKVVIDDNFSGTGTGSWDKSFSTTDEQDTYNIEISNTGTNQIKLFIKESSENGENKIEPITIESLETAPAITMQTDSGSKRFVVISSADGEEFQGEINITIGNVN